jgi:hypothetical protein
LVSIEKYNTKGTKILNGYLSAGEKLLKIQKKKYFIAQDVVTLN